MNNNKLLTEHTDFGNLLTSVEQTHFLLQENAVKAVNYNLTVRNWLVGCYIVEYEQNGEDRAKYGTRLLEELAKNIKKKGIKGLDLRGLRTCRMFYTLYSQLQQTIVSEFSKVLFAHNLLSPKNQISIRQSLTAELQQSNNQSDVIRGALTPELTDKEDYPIEPELMLSRLSFTHFTELIRIDDNLQRLFYEVEAIKGNWSVRQLERAINSSLAFRTTYSTDKEAIIAKIKNLKPATNREIIREPIVLEFLDLKEEATYSETKLEQNILSHLQEFILELGLGFCFEARQKRITFNNKHYHIDLVFYHRILKCHILFDLKRNEFDHADAGQMNVYLNYFKKYEMSEGDNPPVGIILCPSKDDELVEFATAGMDENMFVSKYLLNLPDKKLLENFIRKEIGK